MAKDPAFLFYSSDFLTGTMLMSDEEVGQYVRLLILQHQQGHFDAMAMRRLCGGNASALVASKFKTDSDGLYYNERLENEVEKRRLHSEKQKQNAHMRWQCHGNATALPLENENRIEIKNGNKRIGGAGGKGINAADLIPADWDRQAFLDNWADFEKIRKAKKKHLTDIAVKRLVGSLVRFSEGEWYKAKAIMEKTIVGAWDAFYELKPGDLDVVEAEKQEEWGVWVNGKKVS